MERNFIPELGKEYLNANGLHYICIKNDMDNIVMQSKASKWTMKVVGLTMYDNNTIEWDYSKNGYFA